MKRILIAEDDQFLANAYRVKLTKAGFEVQITRDGGEALAALQTFTPDIILLDLIMPGKDGFTTLQELKANPKLRDIPVIVASNLGQKEDIEKSTKLGAADFILKSDLSLEGVIAKINAQLPGAAPSSSPATATTSAPSTVPVASSVPPTPTPAPPTAVPPSDPAEKTE
ncbi:MAG TPA: response regulator [Methylomirabilota bacterium]|nr:response regulator [Methylomirabilota bacterium]